MRADDSYEARVARSLADLGIPASYGVDRNMPLQAEAGELVSVGMDIHGRDRQLTPRAAARWAELQEAARRDGVTLQLVSAFRSLEYQRQVFERKIAAGQSLERILKVNAPPGYSEHHTGRTVDLTTPGCPPLSEDFESTAAFGWLVRHARRFGFAMTYPRDNPWGLAYEPWHWTLEQGTGRRTTLMRHANLVAVVLLAVVSLAHLLRLVLGVRVTVADSSIPMWVSAVAFVAAGGVAFMLWRSADRR